MALSFEENETLTRVGRGTPGGEMLRRYWHPIALSRELKNRPIKRRLLGEDLVLFRDDRGRPGLLTLRCAHRGTSLGSSTPTFCRWSTTASQAARSSRTRPPPTRASSRARKFS